MVPICEKHRCCIPLCLQKSGQVGRVLGKAFERPLQGRGRVYEERAAHSVVVICLEMRMVPVEAVLVS